jgi:hyaluronan synthase
LTTDPGIRRADEKIIQVESPIQAVPDQTMQPVVPEAVKKTIEFPNDTASEEVNRREGKKSFQSYSESGRIYVSNKGWLLRLTILTLLIGITAYYMAYGITISNSLVVYPSIMLIYSVLILVVGWFFFKSKKITVLDNGLVSVIIPIYNQKNMIKVVIEAVNASSYKNIEVIAINDGSTDGTTEILDALSKVFSNLKVIHQANQGKRKAVAKGFRISKGKFIILIDSDSVVTENAIAHIVGTFASNPKAGAISGHAKLWNANRNFVSKLQDTWYDYSFNVQRTTESVFGGVMCCPGCMSAYRRESIAGFIRHWSTSNDDDSENRMLTSYAHAPADIKSYISPDNVKLSNFSRKQMESAAEYDDADDRLLTSQSLSQEWHTLYEPRAVTYTEVPETWRAFLKQHLRWKKAYVRCSLFVSSFFWKSSMNPLMKFLFYIELMTVYTAPLIIAITYFYLPFIKGDLFAPIFYTIGILFMGFAQGIDYRCRDPGAKYWLLQILMGFIQLFVQSGLLISALFVIKKNNWLTR